MILDIEKIRRIYKCLGDELSKDIFKNRLMYSISQDTKWIFENVKSVQGGKEFLEKLDYCAENGEMVIFGAGVWGKDLYKVTKDYPWNCFVDSNPKVDEFEGISVISYADFISGYHGEYIFISSRIHYREMYQQLLNSNISEDKIINVGKMLDDLTKCQYFDLEYLQPTDDETEIFVDTGSFDGMTSVYFGQWGKTDMFVYAFEPDALNAEKCHQNLEKHSIPHEVIPRGAWCEETILKFQAVANGTSSVNELGDESIKVTTLDKALCDVPVTFIKMDIEGSELQALQGAKDTIIKNKPKLAISIYHKEEDIWKLPEIILEYNPEYKLYLRHYSLTDYETVLYAVP